MPASPFDVVRSLLFYAAFYGGTVPIVLSCILAYFLGERTFRTAIHSWSAWHRICMRRLLGIRIVIEGEAPRESVLLALKHESFYEAIDLPQLVWLPVPFAKIELMRLPLWGRLGRAYGLVGVERDQGAKALRTMMAAARKHIATGRPLAIFPEGTRVPHGTRPPLQSGFAGLYKLMNLPCVPVAVDSGPLYHRVWKRPGTITVRFCEPIPPRLPRDEIEARVHAAINQLNANAPA